MCILNVPSADVLCLHCVAGMMAHAVYDDGNTKYQLLDCTLLRRKLGDS